MISGLILDTNIVISSIIKPQGFVTNFMYTELMHVQFIAPSYLFHETLHKEKKILSITGYSSEEFHELLQIIGKRITWIDMGLIDQKYLDEAKTLVEDIDPKDFAFVALSLQTKYPIWSGDIKLINGLAQKGFTNIYQTEELRKQLGNI